MTEHINRITDFQDFKTSLNYLLNIRYSIQIEDIENATARFGDRFKQGFNKELLIFYAAGNVTPGNVSDKLAKELGLKTKSEFTSAAFRNSPPPCGDRLKR